MSKLIWNNTTHNTQIGSTDDLCDIDVYEAVIEIKLGEDVIFSFAVSVFSETDIKTGEQLITSSYLPQGEYRDMFIPLDDADTRYASIEEAKDACEKKAEEVIRYLYNKLEIWICRLSC